MVVVDKFSKYSVFVDAPELCSSEVAADMFYKYVVKYFVFRLKSRAIELQDSLVGFGQLCSI